MSIVNITVNSKAACLSTIVNGKEYTKTVKHLDLEYKCFEVDAILLHLIVAFNALKKASNIHITIKGTERAEQLVLQTKWLAFQSYKGFIKKNGSDIYMKKHWEVLFANNSLALDLLRSNRITFEYEYFYKSDSNYAGD